MEFKDNNSYEFPAQKIPESRKTKKWFEKCAEAAIAMANMKKYNDNYYENKLSNYKLVNNIIDREEIQKALNPFKIQGKEIPVEYRNYPLINPVLNLLSGEERKRPYNFMVSVINQDALTEKLELKNQEFSKLIYSLILDENLDEKQLEAKLQRFAHYMKYDFKTAQEQLGNQVLQYLNVTQDLKEEFNRGFIDFLISGEEIYVAEIINGEPVLRKADPLNITIIGSNNTWKIEDADIIVEETFLSKGSVIDKYNEYLTDSQISLIESNFRKRTGESGYPTPTIYTDIVPNKDLIIVDDDIMAVDDRMVDEYGNVKVTRVLWSGFRKIGVVSYYNEDMELEKTLVPETYEPDEELGETVKWIWVREWYEATKIGDFYIKTEPCAIQIRNMDNPSICNPGIVGTTLYSVSNGLIRSLVDEAKVLQYMYNLYMAKLELAIKKFKGRIGKLPLHLVPDTWDIDKWLYYAEYMGWAVEDAYSESSKPVFQGKPAGMFQQGAPVIDLSTGNEIQMYVNLLEFIERRFSDITGITPQRKGAISASETVGGVERSVIQSSNITERWFAIHDNTRKRALRILLEAAKIAWRGKSFVKEYVLDHGTRNILKFDYNSFKIASYGVDVVDSSREMAALDRIRSLSETIIQNGGTLSMVASLHRINNLGELQRKIEEYEAQIQQMREQEAQRQQEMLQAQLQDKERDRQIQIEENQKDREADLLKAQINAQAQIYRAQLQTYISAENVDQNNNGIPDPVEIAKVGNEKIKNEVQKYLKEKELNIKEQESKRKLDLERKKLELEEKKLKQDKELREKEMKTALKNKVAGEK